MSSGWARYKRHSAPIGFLWQCENRKEHFRNGDLGYRVFPLRGLQPRVQPERICSIDWGSLMTKMKFAPFCNLESAGLLLGIDSAG